MQLSNKTAREPRKNWTSQTTKRVQVSNWSIQSYPLQILPTSIWHQIWFQVEASLEQHLIIWLHMAGRFLDYFGEILLAGDIQEIIEGFVELPTLQVKEEIKVTKKYISIL